MDPVAGAEEDQARRDSLESESGNMVVTQEQEGFFNLLTHVQGARIDEQRCSIQIVHSKGESDEKDERKPCATEEFIEGLLPENCAQAWIQHSSTTLCLLLSAYSSKRVDRARSAMYSVYSVQDGSAQDPNHPADCAVQAQGIPPPEMNLLMDMLAQSQSRRLDDQRADFIQSTGFPDTMPTRRLSNDNGALKETEAAPGSQMEVPFSSGDDYFSFINQVHSRHLEKMLKNPGGRKKP